MVTNNQMLLVVIPELSVRDVCEGCEDGEGVDRSPGVEVSSVGMWVTLVVGDGDNVSVN